MDKEQINEWENNPVTILYHETLKEILTDLFEVPRYTSTTAIGQTLTTTTMDACAMQNAFHQGRIDAIQEIINLNLEKSL